MTTADTRATLAPVPTCDAERVPPRTRVDWASARAFFVNLEPGRRTFPAVAAEFGVSDTTVRKWARRQGWEQLAAEADRKAADAALAASVKSREARAVQTVRIRDLAADKLEKGLTPNDAGTVALDDNTAVHVWKEADRQYRLDIGEATDRIEVREVHEFVHRLVIGFDKLVVDAAAETLNGQGRALIALVRERMPALLELTAGSGASE